MKKMTHTLAVLTAFAMFAFTSAANAAVVTLSPGDELGTGTNGFLEDTGNFNPKADDIEGYFDLDFDIEECYKDEADGEEGDFAGSYSTDIDFSSDPTGGTISYTGGPKITGTPIYLLVKDGNHSPWWYVFDISDWDGMMDIELSGFWADGGGSISHVSIFCGPTEIPAPAALPAGLAILGLAAARRRRR